jgi:HAD superfamily hydrolase (TIGR01509 family)
MKAAIFDMDGLLIDSEPLWRQAEKAMFGELGIELTEQMCHETIGLRPDEAVAYWYARFPWAGQDCREVACRLVDSVKGLVSRQGKPLDGVPGALTLLRDAGLPLGLASSSPVDLIDAVLSRLQLHDYFSVACSAVEEERGKPDPAVYLTAAAGLGVAPAECVAFEDSVPGMRAALSAGMTAVVVPAGEHYHDPDFDAADIKLRSLREFSLSMLDN